MKEDAALESHELHRKSMKTQGFERVPKENKLDVTMSALERTTAKLQTAKAVLLHLQQTKKRAKPGK
jgi:hypothetical protein